MCVFYDALLRVLAVGAVFNTRGTRNVSRQHLRQLSGIDSESLAQSHEQIIVTFAVCFVVFRPKNGYGLWVLHAACVVSAELCCSGFVQCLRACGHLGTRTIFEEIYRKNHKVVARNFWRKV